jgi:hypothetical protein
MPAGFDKSAETLNWLVADFRADEKTARQFGVKARDQPPDFNPTV